MGDIASDLAAVLEPDQVSRRASDRAEHAADWGGDRAGIGKRPAVVVWPASTADVASVLTYATDRDIPVTPYAGGTALEGQAVPADGGISLDLTRMDGVQSVRPDDRQATAEAGVTGEALTTAVAEHDLFLPGLPGSADRATLGGMVATDAGGMDTVKYGKLGEWVLELEVVLADGRVLTLGSRAPKSSSGYNLLDLVVGSEGTLAVVTRVTVELASQPVDVRGARAVFEDVGGAASAAAEAVRSGVDLAKVELVDALSAAMTNDYLGTDLPDAPMVFVECHGSHGVGEDLADCRSVFEAHGLVRFDTAGPDRLADLWRARSELGYALEEWDPNRRPLQHGDVTVALGSYGTIVEYAIDRGRRAGLDVACFGHAGDGNLHYEVMVDPTDDEMVDRGEAVYRDVVERAIELGGTATGEHGIGARKRRYLAAEHGDDVVSLMGELKDVFDPTGTLNPGTVLPE